MQRTDRSAMVIDALKRLRADDTVEAVLGNLRRVRKVGNDGNAGIEWFGAKHIRPNDALAEGAGIAVIAKFQNAPCDRRGLGRDETVDVVAVDWPSPF